MLAPFSQEHWNDAAGRPAGGTSWGTGFCVSWQNGPLGQGSTRKDPNGAFVETIIDVARERLQYYQRSRFNCKENADAIFHLTEALERLNDRTRCREERNVEGTHTI